MLIVARFSLVPFSPLSVLTFVLDRFVDGFLQKNVLWGIISFSTFLFCTLTILIFSGMGYHHHRELLGGC